MSIPDTTLPREYTHAFRDADIRGTYPTQINEEMTYRIARAFVAINDLSELVLGRDMRESSPALRDAFVRGATEQGADVIDIGTVDTPAVYFVSGKRDVYGAMITASHNPKEDNGIKLVTNGALPLTRESGLAAIQERVEENTFADSDQTGQISEEDIADEYRRYINSYVSMPEETEISVVADAGNGMAGWVVPLMCDTLPVAITPVLFELDGTFPHRGSNPTKAENMGSVKDAIAEKQPDFGVAFDGDVDRAAFFDENGSVVNGAVIGAMIAQHMITTGEGERFVYTHYTSRAYYETITEAGAEAYLARVGHSFIKNLMREKDAAFAAEHSGHFYFRANYYTDSGILALLKVLELYASAKADGRTFSELVAEFDRYVQSEEMLIEVADKAGVLERVGEAYDANEPTHADRFDGYYAEFENFWFDLKESTTEDALKLIVEARDAETMRQKCDEIHEYTKQVDKELRGDT